MKPKNKYSSQKSRPVDNSLHLHHLRNERRPHFQCSVYAGTEEKIKEEAPTTLSLPWLLRGAGPPVYPLRIHRVRSRGFHDQKNMFGASICLSPLRLASGGGLQEVGHEKTHQERARIWKTSAMPKGGLRLQHARPIGAANTLLALLGQSQGGFVPCSWLSASVSLCRRPKGTRGRDSQERNGALPM